MLLFTIIYQISYLYAFSTYSFGKLRYCVTVFSAFSVCSMFRTQRHLNMTSSLQVGMFILQREVGYLFWVKGNVRQLLSVIL